MVSLMIDSPVFLIGAERSGTTLLRLLLDHHSEISFQHEFELCVKYLPASGWPDMETYYNQLACDRIFKHSKYTIDRSLDYPHLVNDFLLQKQRESGSKPVIGSTVHYQFSNLTRIWPNSRFIHIIRDGRDVSRSMVQVGWFGNSWNSCVRWLRSENEIDGFRPSVSDDRWIDVRYESLLEDTRGELKRICDFLGIEFDEDMFSYADDSTYEPIDASLAYQWKRKQSQREVQLIESRVGDMLVKRGYTLSGYKPIHTSFLLRTYLSLHSRLGRMKHRLKRYGLKLFCLDFIGRRFRLRSFHSRIRLLMNDIDEKHIR